MQLSKCESPDASRKQMFKPLLLRESIKRNCRSTTKLMDKIRKTELPTLNAYLDEMGSTKTRKLSDSYTQFSTRSLLIRDLATENDRLKNEERNICN